MPSVRPLIARNEAQGCTVAGCRNPRNALALYCAGHRSAYRRYGSPEGRALTCDDLHSPSRSVRQLFHANHQHPGLLEALRIVAGWLDPVTAASSPLGLSEARRLGLAGVSALDVVTEAAAVYVLSRQRPRRLSTTRELRFAIARQVLRLAKLPRSPRGHRADIPGSLLDAVGARVLAVLGRFLANVASAVETQRDAAEQVREAFAAPFSVPEQHLTQPQGAQPNPQEQAIDHATPEQ